MSKNWELRTIYMQVEKNRTGSAQSLRKICGSHIGGISDISLDVHLSVALA
jgi:hypothetical protein